jgi:hypothetical protein
MSVVQKLFMLPCDEANEVMVWETAEQPILLKGRLDVVM